MTDKVEFWFDPVSPWCWVASRWITQVESIRDIKLSFRVMSLAVLNRDKELPDRVRKIVESSLPYQRVLVAAESKLGSAALRDLYGAMGELIHCGDASNRPAQLAIINSSLIRCGLDQGLAEYAAVTDMDDAILASHNARCSDDASESGAPTIQINGVDFFGPALSRVPNAEECGKMYDGIANLLSFPHFFEFSRPRTERPVLG